MKRLTPEHRAKIGAARLGKKHSPETRLKISLAKRGTKPTLETRAKLSAARLGKKRPPRSVEWCQNLSDAHTSSPHLAEWHKKVAEAQRGVKRGPLSPEHRAKCSAAKKGKKKGPLSLVWRENLSASLRSSPAAMAYRARMTSKEGRARMSAALTTSPRAQAHRAHLFIKSPTSIELAVRTALDAVGVDFVFQYPVPGTPYVADFYLPQRNLILEADGDYWHSIPKVKIKDIKRDAMLTACGYRVVHLLERVIRRDVVLAVETVLTEGGTQ